MDNVLNKRISWFITIILLVSQLAIPIVAVAEASDDSVDFLIAAYSCPENPGDVSVFHGNIPPTCTPLGGVTVTATTDAGRTETCMTLADGRCVVQVGSQAWVTVTAQSDRVFVMNPLTKSATEGDAVLVTVDVPVAQPVPVPTDVIATDPAPQPDTGSAPDGDVPGDDADPSDGDTDSTGAEDGDGVVPGDQDGSTDDQGTGEDAGDPDDNDADEGNELPEGEIPSTVDAGEEGDSEDTDTESVRYVMDAGPDGLACYATTQPGAEEAPLHVFADGDPVTVISEEEGGFLKVLCAEEEGFVDASKTSPDQPEPQTVTKSRTGSLPTVVPAGAICYEEPSAESKEIGVLTADTDVDDSREPVGDWLPVKCMSADDEELDGYAQAGQPESLRTTALAPIVAAEQVTADLICYTAPDETSTELQAFSKGSWIGRTGDPTGNWLPVQCGGQNGFVLVALTSAYYSPAPKPIVAAEQITRDVVCFSAPYEGSTHLGTYKAGSWIGRTGNHTFGYLPVQCAGRDGYVYVAYTTAFYAPAPKPIVAAEQITKDLVCFSAPYEGSTHLGTFRAGSWIGRTGNHTFGYLPVQCAGRDGYVYVAHTTAFYAPTPKTKTSTELATRDLVCFSAPYEGSTHLGTIRTGQLVAVTGNHTFGYLPVQCAGRDGYVYVAYTTMYSTALKASIGRTTVLSAGRAGTICRTAPSAEARAITTLHEGTNVNVTGSAVQNWLPVQCAGQNGFLYLAHTTTRLSNRSADTNAWPAVVKGTGGSGLHCRATAGGASIAIMPENSPVDVLNWSNGWAQVRCAGKTGYADMRYLTFSTVDPAATSESIWIDVNLTTQYMIVYQGQRIIGQTHISSGRYPTFETPTGTFYIINKIRVSAMAGCSGGECWHVPDVPHQMYFTNRGHAFHGTYWHNNFGTRRSHGCINLPLGHAEWLYNITPYGTRVVIHY